MTFSDWLSETKERYRTEKFLTATSNSVSELWIGFLRKLGRNVNYGSSIWEENWDVCIILDGCRSDLFKEVTGISGSKYSVASSSKEFIEKTFSDEYSEQMNSTGLIISNPFSHNYKLEHFPYINEVWDGNWSESLGTVPSDRVTDEGMKAWRDKDKHGFDKLIIWYMQPHEPFINLDKSEKLYQESWGERDTPSIWNKLERNEVSEDKVWEGYKNTLEYVWEDVENIHSNISGDILVTSDHGNSFGEFGIYGHPAYVPTPSVKKVPFIYLSGKGSDNWEREYGQTKSSSTSLSVEERLENLGYK